MRRVLLFIASGSLALVTQAQTARDTLCLNEVEYVKPAKVAVTLTPLEVTTVSSAEIEKSAESSVLPVITNHVPGMFLVERGIGGYGVSEGAAGQVSIRGVGGGNKVLFMIDGQPQWAGVFGHSLPDTYTSADVERVEVVSGPSSLLYGSNAMAGSVNIITKHAKQMGLTGGARLAFGSYGTMKSSVNLGYNNGKLNTYAAATYERADGARRDMEYWLSSQYLSANYRLNSNWMVGADATLTETRPHNAGPVYNPLNDMWTQIFRGTASLFVKNSYSISSGGLQVYTNWGHHKISDGYTNDEEPLPYLFKSEDFNMGATLYQTVKPWRGNDLSVGIDFKHWGGKCWNDYIVPVENPSVMPGYDESHNVDETAGYIMMQQAFLDNMLSLNAGARYEHSSQFGNMFVPQAGFIAHFIPTNTLKFSWGKGYRSPNIRELYMFPPHNPDLKPEYMWNYEASLRQQALNGRFDAGVTFFFIDGKDLIQLVPTGSKPPMKQMNAGSFINKGFELDASLRANRQWKFMANYSYLYTNAILVAAPKNMLYGEINFTPGKWEFTVSSRSIWGLRTTTDESVDKQNYSLLNAMVARNIDLGKGVNVRFFIKGDNLCGKTYETVYGYPMPHCATWLSGIDFKF